MFLEWMKIIKKFIMKGWNGLMKNELKIEVYSEFDRGSDEEMEVIKGLVDDLSADIEEGNAEFGKKKGKDTKTVEAIDWNQVIITLVGGSSVVSVTIVTVSKVINAWLSYKKGRKVKIGDKEYTGYSPDEIAKIEKALKESVEEQIKGKYILVS